MSKRTIIAAAAAALLAPLAAGAQECDRACLEGFLDAYMTAQAANDVSTLPLADDVRYTENGVELAPGEGFFATADAPTYQLPIVDPEMGTAAVQALVMEGDAPAFELVRLKVEDGAITEIETIVARDGDSGPLWVPEYYDDAAPRREFTLSIREAERNSRLELMAVADSYWRALETNGWPEYHPAPILPGLVRVENGRITTNGSSDIPLDPRSPGNAMSTSGPQQFNDGMFANRTIWERRFPVVDVERGVVLSIARMGLKEGDYEIPGHWQGGNPALAEFFAIQNGQIVAVEVVMNSTVPTDRSLGWGRSPLTSSIGDKD